MTRNPTQQMKNLHRLEILLRERYRIEQDGGGLTAIDEKIAALRARIDATRRDVPVQEGGKIKNQKG